MVPGMWNESICTFTIPCHCKLSTWAQTGLKMLILHGSFVGTLDVVQCGAAPLAT